MLNFESGIAGLTPGQVALWGFRSGDRGTHTSRTIMLDDLSHLLDAVPGDAVREEYADAVMARNCLGKRTAGLHAAAGTLGAGAGDSVRLALLGIVFKSADLPESYPQARFCLWLKKNGIYEQVCAAAGPDSPIIHVFVPKSRADAHGRAAAALRGGSHPGRQAGRAEDPSRQARQRHAAHA